MAATGTCRVRSEQGSVDAATTRIRNESWGRGEHRREGRVMLVAMALGAGHSVLRLHVLIRDPGRVRATRGLDDVTTGMEVSRR